MDKDYGKKLFQLVREKKPLVHHITNNVTINDCANITLAIGGSPVMADSIEEVEEMVSHANSLVLNLGTLNKDVFEAMKAAGKRANSLGIPVVFDPVGVGATKYRTDRALELLKEVKVSIIRGNHSEVASLVGNVTNTRGVDSGEVGQPIHETALKAACEFGAIAVISGKDDVVSDGRRYCLIQNGHEMLTRITGTGCTSATLIAAFAGVTDKLYEAAIVGISVMGISGQRALQSTNGDIGLGTFKMHLIDEISVMNGDTWEREVMIHEQELEGSIKTISRY